MIVTSITKVFDQDITMVEKQPKGDKAIVILCDDCVIVTNGKLHGRRPHIAAVWDMSHSDKSLIVEKYRHVIAKMVTKPGIDSKYFDKPIYAEHFRNGKPGKLNMMDIEQRCMDALERCGCIV